MKIQPYDFRSFLVRSAQIDLYRKMVKNINQKKCISTQKKLSMTILWFFQDIF